MIQDAVIFNEYGMFKNLDKIPNREFEAHLAILKGKLEEEERQYKKAERKSRRNR